MSENMHPLVPWGEVPKVERPSPETGHGTGSASAPAQVEPPAAQPRQFRKAIVFVHGIHSSHDTFGPTKERMAATPALAGVEFHYFDYPSREPMETNGERLATALRAARFGEGDRVAIVAHSMGGLVSRFAILSQRLEFVRALFLVGTPNSGALRLSQLTALAQLMHGATNRLFTLFPRRSGIPSLSQAAELIEARRVGFINAIDIDYVSIPGLFYHTQRSVWHRPRHASGAAFTTLEAAFFLLHIIRLDRPHDGIVDEASNHLARCVRSTEKVYSYGGTRGKQPATYAHLTLAACREVNHVQIHTEPGIVDVVADLIAAKFADNPVSLEQWGQDRDPATTNLQELKMAFG